MIVFYINHKDASKAVDAFEGSAWVQEYKKVKVEMNLSFFHTKENKIYATGLKDVDEKHIQEAFSIFG